MPAARGARRARWASRSSYTPGNPVDAIGHCGQRHGQGPGPGPGRARVTSAIRSRPIRRRARPACRARSGSPRTSAICSPRTTRRCSCCCWRAILSANLALVNILPFPPLDGGKVAIMIVKRVFGKRGVGALEIATNVIGFGLLMAFIGWISYFDIIQGRPVAMGGAGLRRAATLAAVDVGGVVVGGGHPIVVQSMTNTDTADADATAHPGRAAGPCRLGAGPDHGQHRGGRRRGSGDRAQGPRPGRRGADRRRLPLQRPQAAGRLPGDGAGRSTSTASTPATWARAATTTITSRRSSGSRSRTASRSGSASTGARWTRRSWPS